MDRPVVAALFFSVPLWYASGVAEARGRRRAPVKVFVFFFFFGAFFPSRVSLASMTPHGSPASMRPVAFGRPHGPALTEHGRFFLSVAGRARTGERVDRGLAAGPQNFTFRSEPFFFCFFFLSLPRHCSETQEGCSAPRSSRNAQAGTEGRFFLLLSPGRDDRRGPGWTYGKGAMAQTAEGSWLLLLGHAARFLIDSPSFFFSAIPAARCAAAEGYRDSTPVARSRYQAPCRARGDPSAVGHLPSFPLSSFLKFPCLCGILVAGCDRPQSGWARAEKASAAEQLTGVSFFPHLLLPALVTISSSGGYARACTAASRRYKRFFSFFFPPLSSGLRQGAGT